MLVTNSVHGCSQYLVKRKGVGCTGYGLVDAQAAKRQRLTPPAADDAAQACAVSLAQVNEYEVRYSKSSTSAVIQLLHHWICLCCLDALTVLMRAAAAVLTAAPSARS